MANKKSIKSLFFVVVSVPDEKLKQRVTKRDRRGKRKRKA
jgi:hypothetical protein